MRSMGTGSVASVLAALLNIAWYGIAVILAIAFWLLIFGANVAFQVDSDGPAVQAGPDAATSIPVAVHIDPAAVPITAPALGIDRAQLRNLRGALRFPARRGTAFVVSILVVVGSLGLAWWIIGQLRAVFRTLRAGQPFVAANAVRLRRIAWALIAGEIARSAIVFFENYYAMTHFAAPGVIFEARPHLNVFAILNGAIVLVVAEVFREGTRLDEDRSLTI